MAQTMLTLLFSQSFSGSVVIMLIFFFCMICRKKLSYKWQYYIWAAAIVRLLLPFGPAENLAENAASWIQDSLYAAVEHAESPAPSAPVPEADNTDRNAHADIHAAQSLPDSLDNQTSYGDLQAQSRQYQGTADRPAISLLHAVWAARNYLCVFWLLTAALLFLHKATVYQDFIRFIRAGSMPVDQIDSLEALSELESRLGIKKAIDLWECPLISSPMLIGFVHPCIVLPKKSLSQKQLYYTMLHELIHFKRKDMYYKWAAQLALCIHWFNPLAYYMGRMVSRLCELSCDEAACALVLSDDQRKEYAQTLLEAMSPRHCYQEPLASITLNGNKNILKERLESIMNLRKQTLPQKILAAILTAAVTLAGIYSGGSLTCAFGNTPSASTQSKTDSLNTKSSSQGTAADGRSTNSDILNTADDSPGTKNDSPDNSIHTLAGARSSSENISPAQADEMALALINKIWVWDWVAFFVPYMSDDGIDQLLPASKHAEWAGWTDQTTGKKLKITKKQIRSARKSTPSQALTRKDIDRHAMLIMQSNGDWECISFMLPYMTRRGIRAVTRCYNSKHGGSKKHAQDYF